MEPAPTTSRRQQRTERTRAQLLDAAVAVFVEEGYDGASTGRITERADLGAGTFYLHFKDKRSVYEAVIRRRQDGLRQRYAEARAKKPKKMSWKAELGLLVELVLKPLLANRPIAKLILLDGPPLETWLVDEMGRELAGSFRGRVASPELVSHMVIGAILSGGRRALLQPRATSTSKLIDEVASFCAAGVSAAAAQKKNDGGN